MEIAATSLQTRPFLKWAGNKYRLLEHIKPLLPAGKKLIEPFAGSAAVFLNTHYNSYLLSDINPDLIHLYQLVQQQGDNFIDRAADYFKPRYNNEDKYYQLRDKFNRSKNIVDKSALFLYLNRHGYNGLCRYNSKRQFNVPFGRYVKPYFPVRELQYFHHKAQVAEFICEDFLVTLKRARKGHVVYCDPPYVPLSHSANFTAYGGNGFNLQHQQQLAAAAKQLAGKNIPVLLSNHDTPYTRELYTGSQQVYFPIQRFISCQGHNRQPVYEMLALFGE
jgi:DNA adenine methylase